jgi:transcription elongation factor Elf1
MALEAGAVKSGDQPITRSKERVMPDGVADVLLDKITHVKVEMTCPVCNGTKKVIDAMARSGTQSCTKCCDGSSSGRITVSIKLVDFMSLVARKFGLDANHEQRR